MKIGITIGFIIVFLAGLFIGAAYSKLQGYARVAPNVERADLLLSKLEDYKKQHGGYPDEAWFRGLGDERLTLEDRLWIYYNPPHKMPSGREVLIAAPMDYGNGYLCGYIDGVVVVRPGTDLTHE